ncbi:MAG: hypothetical protein K940chlam9_01230 [Chlamydiae bacterium]|nr:hypothetical protein [Chlamydiota bacterium]
MTLRILLGVFLLFCSFQDSKVWVFAYGSLMHEGSASRTLSREALESRRPAVAYGVKRIYNRQMPEELIIPRFGPLAKPSDRAALNVKQTGQDSDRVNGVLVKVSHEELRRLAEREIGYDRIQVPVTFWGEEATSSPFMAYSFSAPDTKPLTSREITPIPGYLELVEEGAASYGPTFLRQYLQETFLADEQTPLFTRENIQDPRPRQ